MSCSNSPLSRSGSGLAAGVPTGDSNVGGVGAGGGANACKVGGAGGMGGSTCTKVSRLGAVEPVSDVCLIPVEVGVDDATDELGEADLFFMALQQFVVDGHPVHGQ